MTVEKNVARHKLIMRALDQEQGIFDISQRYTAFRGYVSAKFKLLKQELCDDPQGVCRTDVDHTLGYYNDTGLTLTLTHHQVNSCLHHIRNAIGEWRHAIAEKQEYVSPQSRRYPDFMLNLPPTLKPGDINHN